VSQEPLSFGKPLAILVLAGCIGGGYYAYKNWPTMVDGNGWSAHFPPRWEVSEADGKTIVKGPLGEGETASEGAAWVSVNVHGTLDWPRFVLDKLPEVPDFQMDDDINHKKALLFTYPTKVGETARWKYTGAAVQRGDAVVILVIGCPEDQFPKYEPLLNKAVKSIKVNR
jgi:hypothetical protein